jgi:hypothetical protein
MWEKLSDVRGGIGLAAEPRHGERLPVDPPLVARKGRALRARGIDSHQRRVVIGKECDPTAMAKSAADSTDPAERNCYCGLWDTSPATLEAAGVPPGHCGLCQVCGRPGHLRHFPGAVAFTGAWCDRHYRRTLWFHPRGSIGHLVWPALVAVLVGLVFLLTRTD